MRMFAAEKVGEGMSSREALAGLFEQLADGSETIAIDFLRERMVAYGGSPDDCGTIFTLLDPDGTGECGLEVR